MVVEGPGVGHVPDTRGVSAGEVYYEGAEPTPGKTFNGNRCLSTERVRKREGPRGTPVTGLLRSYYGKLKYIQNSSRPGLAG